MMYETLNETLRAYVDALVTHAGTALWPERRMALESFRRGVAKSSPADLAAVLETVPVPLPPYLDKAEALYRVVLTAYLERLGEPNVTNLDQAALFLRSLDSGHLAEAEGWLDAHPEHKVG